MTDTFSNHASAKGGAKSVDEFCRNYSISRSTFYLAVRDEKLRVVKLGRKTIVLARDEAAFVALLSAEEFVPVKYGRHRRGEAA